MAADFPLETTKAPEKVKIICGSLLDKPALSPL
jgi:hypothetical protein